MSAVRAQNDDCRVVHRGRVIWRTSLSLAMAATTLLPAIALGQASPVALSVLGQESSARAVSPNPRDLGDALFDKLDLDPQKWDTGKRATIELGATFARERDKLSSVSLDAQGYVDGARFVQRMATTAAGLSGLVPGAQGVAVGLVGVGLFSDLNLEYRERQFEWRVGQAQAERDRNIRALAENVVRKAASQLPSTGSPEQRAQRLAQLQEQILGSDTYARMDGAEREAVKTQMHQFVTTALTESARQNAQRASELERTQADNLSRAVALRKDAEAAVAGLTRQATRLQAMAEDQAARTERLSQRVDELHGDVAALQEAAFAQMGPRERLQMLKNPKFLPKLKDREKEIEALQVRVDILDARDEVLTGLQVANDAAALAKALGLPIDLANFSHNITMASTTTNMVASYLSGDPVAAFSGLARLAGLAGGPQNPNEGLMKALRQVMELQKQTLQRLQMLSEQLAASTQTITQSLSNLSEQTTLTLVYLERADWRLPFSRCREFIDTGVREPFRLDSGHFASYAMRAEHFRTWGSQDAASASNLYEGCRTLMHHGGMLERASDLQYVLPPALWNYRLNPGPAPLPAAGAESPEDAVKSIWTYHTSWFAPMLRLHREVLNLDASPACADRLLGALAVAPMELEEVARLAPCSSSPVQAGALASEPARHSGLYVGEGADKPVSFDRAMFQVAHPARALEFGEMVLFAAPYEELIVFCGPADGNCRQRLVDEAALKDGQVNAPGRSRGSTYLSNYAAVARIVLAQQVLLSGPFVAPTLAKVLREQNFGFNDASARTRMQNLDALYRQLDTARVKRQGAGAVPLTEPFVHFIGRAASEPAVGLPADWANETPLRSQRAALQSEYENDFVKRPKGMPANAPGYCPVERYEKEPAAVALCMMDWHPTLARNVLLVLVRQALAESGIDLRVYDRWMRGDFALALEHALPGLRPTLVTTPGGPIWAMLALHPSGKRMVLPLPMAPEVEQAQVALTVPAESLYRLTAALMDRAAAMSTAVVDGTHANTEVMKRLWLRRPELSAAATGAIRTPSGSIRGALAAVAQR